MRHSLSLEFVAENRHYELSMHKKYGLTPSRSLIRPLPQRPWVAEIRSFDPHRGFDRIFLRGDKDYSQSNGCASRGVLLCFILDDEIIYEVHEPLGWKKFRRYFVRYNGYEKRVLQRDEVIQCLNGHSASMS